MLASDWLKIDLIQIGKCYYNTFVQKICVHITQTLKLSTTVANLQKEKKELKKKLKDNEVEKKEQISALEEINEQFRAEIKNLKHKLMLSDNF